MATLNQNTTDAEKFSAMQSLNPNITPGQQQAILDAFKTPQQTPQNQPMSSQQTIGSAFNFSNPTPSYEGDQGYIDANNLLGKQMRGEEIVDVNAIRTQKLGDVQDRINALNQVYAGELARVKQIGVGNVGSGTSILASRGLSGSLRGEAIKTGITDQNLKAEQAVEAERNAAIQGIMSEAGNAAVEEARLKRESMLGGAKAYIENLKGVEERKSGYTDNVVGQFLSQGIDPSTMSPKELGGIASQLGIKTNDIISRYQQAKKIQDAEEQQAMFEAEKDNLGLEKTRAEIAKIENDIAKGNLIEISEGTMLYDTQTGETFKNPKTYKPEPGSTIGTGVGLDKYPSEIQAAAQSILDGKSKLNEYPNAKRLQINQAMSEVYNAEGGNELAQGAYDAISVLENHPGMKRAVGTNWTLGTLKNIAGTQSAGFLSELDKLKANLKLVNIKYLKGTGALSDAEGATLENAGTSLNPSLPESQFKTELARVKEALLKANNVKQVDSNISSDGTAITAPDGQALVAPDGQALVAPDGQEVIIID